ncbi:MAG: hypothetical protein LUD82_00375 [Clostridiales bacterium]|nr:hypothetical protein [Clostridiales bacterium]
MDSFTGREAVYLGVAVYGSVSGSGKADFCHRFFADGGEWRWRIRADTRYSIQNRLMEGYLYRLTVAGGVVTEAEPLGGTAEGIVEAVGKGTLTVGGAVLPLGYGARCYAITTAPGGATVAEMSIAVGDSVKTVVRNGRIRTVYKAFLPELYRPPVPGVPGERTLRNLLATALEAVGTVLYVYGGGWSWQDEGASPQAETIGLPRSWLAFFQAQDASYQYQNSGGPARSYYPHNGWNQYYYAGTDCSGYLGWVLYNVTNGARGGPSGGYVVPAARFAQSLSQRGWGVLTRDTAGGFRAGDVVSVRGHVWLALGTCRDGSIVLLHATPSPSITGAPGGGVQISTLSPEGRQDCEACRLVDRYMRACYSRWSQRYNAVLCDYERYTAIAADERTGKFTWDLNGEGLLIDPEGYAGKEPAALLAELLGRAAV